MMASLQNKYQINRHILNITILLITSLVYASKTYAFNIHSTYSPPTQIKSYSTTVEAPTKTSTRQTTKKRQDSSSSDNNDNISRYNDSPLEYLEDEWSTRNPEDPFHILLLDSTFSKNDKITIPYVSGCITYVLGMPQEEANDLTNMAKLNGMSCLGTWEREECLSLGRKLQIRDVVVRVVPFCEGGSRGWQAKDASGAEKGSFSKSGASYD